MKTQNISLNGIKHHVYIWGQKHLPPLFFLHGWMDTGASFEFIEKHLSRRYFCIAPDLRGFGKSSHARNPLGYFFYDYIADFHALSAAFSPNKPFRLIGHSLGGNVASCFAGSFPDRVSHLVNIEGFGLMDMPPSIAPDKLRLWIESTHSKKKFKLYKSLDDVAKRLRQTNPRLNDKRALFLAKHTTTKSKLGFKFSADPRQKWTHPYIHRLDVMYAFWNRITAKTLNVIGDSTEINQWIKSMDDLESELNRRLENFPKGSEKIIIKNSGHMIHHEQPDQLAKVISGFLKS